MALSSMDFSSALWHILFALHYRFLETGSLRLECRGLPRIVRLGLLLLAITALPRPARARPNLTFGVDWIAADECPSVEHIRSSVAALVGFDAWAPSGASLFIEAHSSRKSDGLWHGSVKTRLGEKTGERKFVAESCQAVADSTALLIALIIDPEAIMAHMDSGDGQRETEAPKTPLKPLPPTPTNPRPAPAPVEPRPRSEREFGFRIGPSLLADLGTLPKPGLGFGLETALVWSTFAAKLGAVTWLSQHATVPNTAPTSGGDFSLNSAYLAGCPLVNWSSVALGACAKLNLDAMRAVGVGNDIHPTSASLLRLSAGLGGVLDLRLTRHFSVTLDAEGLLPLTHPTFVLRNVSEAGGRVHKPSSLVGRTGVGTNFEF